MMVLRCFIVLFGVLLEARQARARTGCDFSCERVDLDSFIIFFCHSPTSHPTGLSRTSGAGGRETEEGAQGAGGRCWDLGARSRVLKYLNDTDWIRESVHIQ